MLEKLGDFGKFSLFLALALLVSPCVHAQEQFKILHNFGSGIDGAGLWSPVVTDRRGNLYGTTTGGGEYEQGIVYQLRLNPALSGEWTEAILHNFPSMLGDGWADFGGVTVDSLGNLYGTTWQGGANSDGVAFELASGSDGWAETILHDFCSLPNCADGGGQSARPLIDPAGNLFDTGDEVLYELSPSPNGWIDTGLYTFCAELPPCSDGWLPDGALVRDRFGNIYGVTSLGGYYTGYCQQTGCGVVYELAQIQPGVWQESVLYAFEGGDDGNEPAGALTLHAGALYGVTEDGGGSGCDAGCGTVFELVRTPNGATKETVLYRFGNGVNGSVPIGPVVFDRAGNIYGVTGSGGNSCACGVLYELTPGTNGTWQYTVLHAFDSYDGVEPTAGLTIDGSGNIYGTTVLGGKFGGGVVFEYVPH
jgi:uncharacterized repeat protein (TIGR03803 family)